MNNLEMKVDALMRYCAADTDDDRNSALAKIRELVTGINTKPTSTISREIEFLARQELLNLGVPAHILGHDYLVAAIRIAVEDPRSIHQITNILLPAVAKANGTTPVRAERCMRHAIESSWNRCDVEILISTFGNTIRIDKGKPTVAEFIARLANIVREQM